MVRKEYWDNAKGLLDWCTEDELKVLSQQAAKALEKRMNHYLGKFDEEEHKRHVNNQRLAKRNVKRKQRKQNEHN